VVVLGRGAAEASELARRVPWDGRTLDAWAAELEGAEVVVNLAGRSVNCRYTPQNLTEMLTSRVDSTQVIGLAIAAAQRPPRVWLQMSTATIYAHSLDGPNDEVQGRIGGDEPGAPGYWRYSVEIAKAWERAQQDANTPATRKVQLRTAMVMSPDRGGIFATLLGLTRLGLGGAIGGGRQRISWIHERDFVRAVSFLSERADLQGPINLSSPGPLQQRAFMAALRAATKMPLGLPAAAWMAKAGAFFLRTDAELVLKSRWVLPGRLLAAGFVFEEPEWAQAARELVRRSS